MNDPTRISAENQLESAIDKELPKALDSFSKKEIKYDGRIGNHLSDIYISLKIKIIEIINYIPKII
jgi:hypothetical protein